MRFKAGLFLILFSFLYSHSNAGTIVSRSTDGGGSRGSSVRFSAHVKPVLEIGIQSAKATVVRDTLLVDLHTRQQGEDLFFSPIPDVVVDSPQHSYLGYFYTLGVAAYGQSPGATVRVEARAASGVTPGVTFESPRDLARLSPQAEQLTRIQKHRRTLVSYLSANKAHCGTEFRSRPRGGLRCGKERNPELDRVIFVKANHNSNRPEPIRAGITFSLSVL